MWGYTTDTIAQNEFVIKAIQFEDVESGKVEVNKVFAGFTGVDYDDDSAFMLTAPQIQVQSATGYDIYYYLNDAHVEADESTKPGWADAGGNHVEPSVKVGAGFWVKSADAVTVQFNR